MFRLLALFPLFALAVSANAQENKIPPASADEPQLLLEKGKELVKKGPETEAIQVFTRIIEKAKSSREQQLIRGDAYFFRVRLKAAPSVLEFSQAKDCWLACGLTKEQAQDRYDARRKEWDDLLAYRKLYLAGKAPEQLEAKKRQDDEAEAKRMAEVERKRQSDEAERLRLAQEERTEQARTERAGKELAAERAKQAAEQATRDRLLAEEKSKAQREREELKFRQESLREELQSRATREKAKREQEEAASQAKAAALSATVFLFVIIALVITYCVFVLLLAVWVIKDCRNRSVENGLFWMLLIILFGPVPFLIYMASRPNGRLIPCEKCGSKRLPYATMCPHCHEKIERKDISPDRFTEL